MTKDMTTGAITPLLVKFTIPLVLGNLFQLTYNAADSIIVGKFVGEEALAAVGTSNRGILPALRPAGHAPAPAIAGAGRHPAHGRAVSPHCIFRPDLYILL